MAGVRIVRSEEVRDAESGCDDEAEHEHDELIDVRMDDRQQSARRAVDDHHEPADQDGPLQGIGNVGHPRHDGREHSPEGCHLRRHDEDREEQRQHQHQEAGPFAEPMAEIPGHGIQLRLTKLRRDHQTGEDEVEVPAGRDQQHEDAPLVGLPNGADRVPAANDSRPHGAEEEEPAHVAPGDQIIVGTADLAGL